MAEPQLSEGDSEIIRDLAGKMSLVGTVWLIPGAIFLVMGVSELVLAAVHVEWSRLPEAVLHLVGGIVLIAIGKWTNRSADAFGDVLRAQEIDLSRLMDALRNLRKLYSLKCTLIISYLFLLLIVLVYIVGSLIAAAFFRA